MKLALLGDLHYYRPNESMGNCRHEAFFNNVFKAFFRNHYDYYISLGDMTHYGTLEEFQEIYSLIGSFDAAKNFQQILGNHDAISQSKYDLKKQLGIRLYWSIDHKDARIIFLDTTREKSPSEWSGIVESAQLEWLEKEIEASNTKPVLIFSHHPIYNTTDHSTENGLYISNSDEIEEILSRKKGVGVFFNGHNHTHSIAHKNGWHFVQSAAVLCSLSYREVEVIENRITINTVFIKNPELDQLRQLIAENLDGFALIPEELAAGEEKDHSLIVDLVKTKI
jgi:3',5'-cyclic AMP phosphodiesterase CpdA